MNSWYICTIICAIFILALIFTNTIDAYVSQRQHNKSQQQLNSFRNEAYKTNHDLEVLINLARSSASHGKRQRREAVNFSNFRENVDGKLMEEEQLGPNCDCKAGNCHSQAWYADGSKYALKPSKELNNFFSSLNKGNRKMFREISLLEGKQNAYEQKSEGNAVVRRGHMRTKAKSKSKSYIRKLKMKKPALSPKGASNDKQNPNVFHDDLNISNSNQIAEDLNLDLSNCQQCAHHVDNGVFKNNFKADKGEPPTNFKNASKNFTFSTKFSQPSDRLEADDPELNSYEQKYATAEKKYEDEDEDEDDLYKIKYPYTLKLDNRKNDYNFPALATDKENFSLNLNDQLENTKNSLAHEANYKLSRDEQDGQENEKNRSWKLSLFKRSYPFNAMNEIKLKTSKRLMKKGFGASLPSFSLGETHRDLIIAKMLRRREREKLEDQNRKYETHNESTKNNVKDVKNHLEDLADVPLEPISSSLPQSDWSYNRQKRITEPNARYKRSLKIVDQIPNKPNKAYDHSIIAVEGKLSSPKRASNKLSKTFSKAVKAQILNSTNEAFNSKICKIEKFLRASNATEALKVQQGEEYDKNIENNILKGFVNNSPKFSNHILMKAFTTTKIKTKDLKTENNLFPNDEVSIQKNFKQFNKNVYSLKDFPVKHNNRLVKNSKISQRLQFYNKKFNVNKKINNRKALTHNKLFEVLNKNHFIQYMPRIKMATNSAGNDKLILVLTKNFLQKAFHLYKSFNEFLGNSVSYAIFSTSQTKPSINFQDASTEGSPTDSNKALKEEQNRPEAFKSTSMKSKNIVEKISETDAKVKELQVRAFSGIQHNDNLKSFKNFWDSKNNFQFLRSFYKVLQNKPRSDLNFAQLKHVKQNSSDNKKLLFTTYKNCTKSSPKVFHKSFKRKSRHLKGRFNSRKLKAKANYFKLNHTKPNYTKSFLEFFSDLRLLYSKMFKTDQRFSNDHLNSNDTTNKGLLSHAKESLRENYTKKQQVLEIKNFKLRKPNKVYNLNKTFAFEGRNLTRLGGKRDNILSFNKSFDLDTPKEQAFNVDANLTTVKKIFSPVPNGNVKPLAKKSEFNYTKKLSGRSNQYQKLQRGVVNSLAQFPLKSNNQNFTKALKRSKRSVKTDLPPDRKKSDKTKLLNKDSYFFHYGDFYKPAKDQRLLYDILRSPQSGFNVGRNKVLKTNRNVETYITDNNFDENRKAFDPQKGHTLKGHKSTSEYFDIPWFDSRTQKPSLKSKNSQTKYSNYKKSPKRQTSKYLRSFIAQNKTQHKDLKPKSSSSKIKMLENKYLHDLRKFNKNYEFGDKNFKWPKAKANLNKHFTDDEKLKLELRDEILNCKAFATLEEFIKSLPKNLTQTLLSANAKPDVNSLTTETLEMNANAATAATEASETFKPLVLGSKVNCSTTTEKVIANDFSETTLEAIENVTQQPEMESSEFNLQNENENTKTSYTEPILDSMTTEYEYNLPTTMDPEDIKLNITVNANVHGNTKNNHYHGNGSLSVMPGLMDDRQRRHIFPSSQQRIERRKFNPVSIQKPNAEEDYEDLNDLMSGKLSSRVVKNILNTVRQSPQFEELWPSLKQNDPIEVPKQPNFYAIKDQQNEKELKKSEKLLDQVMSSINTIIEQRARSQACIPLRPELQEFYNLIIESRRQQDLVREKLQKIKNTKKEDLSYKIHLIDPSKIEDITNIVKKLLKQYDELPREDQQLMAGVRDDLIKNLSILQQLQNASESREQGLEDDKDGAWDVNVEKVMKSLQSLNNEQPFGEIISD